MSLKQSLVLVLLVALAIGVWFFVLGNVVPRLYVNGIQSMMTRLPTIDFHYTPFPTFDTKNLGFPALATPRPDGRPPFDGIGGCSISGSNPTLGQAKCPRNDGRPAPSH